MFLKNYIRKRNWQKSLRKEDKMAGRYLITGVQLGMLTAMKDEKDRIDLLRIIEEDQFIGNSDIAIKEDVKWHEKLARRKK